MFKRGILTEEQYLQLEEKNRRFCGARIAYNLLDVGKHPSEKQIRMFEDISFTLFTSNGTTRTTFPRRFENVDRLTMEWIGKLYPPGSPLHVQDRAVSHGLTSEEFARQIFQVYPQAEFEASDLLLSLVELSLSDGSVYIAEQNGTPLQYIKAPFAVPLSYPESARYPVNRWVAAQARRRFHRLKLPEGWTQTEGGPGFKVRQIPYIHPKVLTLSQENKHFCFRMRSVFEPTPGACQVLRTMNIFNRSYFSTEQLTEGAGMAFESLVPGGLWIVGRTLEEDFSNHVTFLRREANGWQVLGRMGQGSEMEAMCSAR